MTRCDTFYHVIVIEQKRCEELFLLNPETGGRHSNECLSFVVHMSRGQQSQFYKTGAWVNCRNNYLKSVGGLCERCKAKGLIVPAEIVHHKIHLNASNITDPTITLNPKNLEALCRVHHAEEHGTVKRFEVMADGTVVPRSE